MIEPIQTLLTQQEIPSAERCILMCIQIGIQEGIQENLSDAQGEAWMGDRGQSNNFKLSSPLPGPVLALGFGPGLTLC
jgi:hypothetical protein